MVMTSAERAGMQVRCSTALRLRGFAYPRTCPHCGLGPCAIFLESHEPLVGEPVSQPKQDGGLAMWDN